MLDDLSGTDCSVKGHFPHDLRFFEEKIPFP